MRKFIYAMSRNIDQTYSRNFLSYSIIYYRINNIISEETTTIYVLDHVILITHSTYDILLRKGFLSDIEKIIISSF